MLPSPIGYILTSSNLLNQIGVYSINSSKRINNFLEVSNFDQFVYNYIDYPISESGLIVHVGNW